MAEQHPTVTTRKLSIVDDKGKEVASFQAALGGAGLWINDPAGNCVAIFGIDGQIGIGLYNRKAQHDSGGMPLCLTLGQDGEPCIQVRDGDDLFWLTAADLKKVAADARPLAKSVAPPKQPE